MSLSIPLPSVLLTWRLLQSLGATTVTMAAVLAYFHHASSDLTARVERLGTQCIAIGTYSDFYKGNLRQWPGYRFQPATQVGIKVLRGGSNRSEFLRAFRKDLEERGMKWIRFHHPNVGEFFGFSYALGNMPALVLPYYPQGNLMHYLIRNRPILHEDKLSLIHQVAQGIKYLHEFTPMVVHGDIRTANIMIDRENHAVLVDYELAFIVDSTQFTAAHTGGTSRWTAPELMAFSDSGGDIPATFTEKTDIFAFAMTMIEVFTEDRPFSQKKTDSAVVFTIINGDRPELPECIVDNSTLKNLTESSWHEEPSQRPTAAKICETLESITPASCVFPRSQSPQPEDQRPWYWLGSWL